MERQRVIIGFTTNELRLFTRLAHKSKIKADENIENGISRWSHKEFLKDEDHDGRVPNDKSDYNIAKEAIEKRAAANFVASIPALALTLAFSIFVIELPVPSASIVLFVNVLVELAVTLPDSSALRFFSINSVPVITVLYRIMIIEVFFVSFKKK